MDPETAAPAEKERPNVYLSEKGATYGDPPPPSKGPIRCDLPALDGDPWKVVVEKTTSHDEGQCAAWKDEIDKVLLFASLFSAIVAAFALDSYKRLEVDYQQSSSVILFAVHQQLDSIARQNISSLPPILPDPDSTFRAPPYAVHINVCWYLSLVLSLATVVIGVLCLQWLREHSKNSNASAEKVFAVRHIRILGLERWQIPGIVGSLPVLLLASLFLFLAGLVIFLWNIHRTVAIVSSAAIGVVVFILFASSILPVVVRQCTFRSPQVWPFYYAWRAVRGVGGWVVFIAAIILVCLSYLCSSLFAWACKALGYPAWEPRVQKMWEAVWLKFFKSRINDALAPPHPRTDWVGMDETAVERDSRRGTTRSFHWKWYTATFSQDKDAMLAFIHCVRAKVAYDHQLVDTSLIRQMIYLLRKTRPEWTVKREVLLSEDLLDRTPLVSQMDFDLGLTLCIRHAVNEHLSLLPQFFYHLLNVHMRLISSYPFDDPIVACLLDNFISDIFKPDWMLISPRPQIPMDVRNMVLSIPQTYHDQIRTTFFECLTLKHTPFLNMPRHIQTVTILDPGFSPYDRDSKSQALDRLNSELEAHLSSRDMKDIAMVLGNLVSYLRSWHFRLYTVFTDWNTATSDMNGIARWYRQVGVSFLSLGLAVNAELSKPEHHHIRDSEEERPELITLDKWDWQVFAQEAFGISPPTPEVASVLNENESGPPSHQLISFSPPAHDLDDGLATAVATPAPTGD